MLVATARSAPFRVTIPLDHTGEVVLKAVAEDRVGNRSAARQLVLTVAADQPPTVTILSPEEGSTVDSGSNVAVAVAAEDDLSATAVTLSASGAVLFSQTATGFSGTTAATAFSLPVPATAAPGSTITLTAVAKDGAGQASAPVQRTLVVRDGVAPTVALSSPGQTSPLPAGCGGERDGDGQRLRRDRRADLQRRGSASGEGSWHYDPTVKQAGQELAFTVDADAAPHAAVTVACTARDAAGNAGNAGLTLQVADIMPPKVVGTSMDGQDLGVATDSPLTVSFDEPLDRGDGDCRRRCCWRPRPTGPRSPARSLSRPTRSTSSSPPRP